MLTQLIPVAVFVQMVFSTEEDTMSHGSEMSTYSTSTIAEHTDSMTADPYYTLLINRKKDFEISGGESIDREIKPELQVTENSQIEFTLTRTSALQQGINSVEVQTFYKGQFKKSYIEDFGKTTYAVRKKHPYKHTSLSFTVNYPVDKLRIINKNMALPESYTLSGHVIHKWKRKCQSKTGEGICCGYSTETDQNGIIPTACIEDKSPRPESYNPCSEWSDWPWNLRDFDPLTNHVKCNKLPDSKTIKVMKGTENFDGRNLLVTKDRPVMLDIGVDIKDLGIPEELDYTNDLFLPFQCEVKTTDKENNFGVTITNVRTGKVLNEDCTLKHSIFRRLRSYPYRYGRKSKPQPKHCYFSAVQTGQTKPQIKISSTRYWNRDNDQFQIVNCGFKRIVPSDGVLFQEKPQYRFSTATAV